MQGVVGWRLTFYKKIVNEFSESHLGKTPVSSLASLVNHTVGFTKAKLFNLVEFSLNSIRQIELLRHIKLLHIAKFYL